MSLLITIIELSTIVLAGIVIYLMKSQYKNVWKRFFVMVLAVVLFMIMSAPMYRNPGLDSWAYIYGDLPWTFILGWSSIFLISLLLVDKIWLKTKEKAKFWLYLLIVTIITVPLESALLKLGVRKYAPMLANTFSGFNLPLTAVPMEVLLAVPILSALIIGFYKYFTKDF